MNKEDRIRKEVNDVIETNDFVKVNSGVMRYMVGAPGWVKAIGITRLFEEGQLHQALDYLQELGAIKVRAVDGKEPVEMCDFDIDEVEIRLTAMGIKLCNHKLYDELLDI